MSRPLSYLMQSDARVTTAITEHTTIKLCSLQNNGEYKKKTREKEINSKSTSGAGSCFEACLHLKKLCISTTNHAIYATHFSH